MRTPTIFVAALATALLAEPNEHEFVTVTGPVEFMMGSPASERGRTPDEVQRRVRIPRSFAIATKETTVAQFRRFLEARPEIKARHAYPNDPGQMAEVMQRFSPDDNSPQIAVTWYEAAQYNVGFRVARTVPPALSQTDAATVRELEKIEQQLAASYTAGDCAAWGAILAPEWSVTHITAQVISKAQALETCVAAKGQIAQIAIDDIRVRLFGDAAVVTGRTIASTRGANPVTVTLRFTDFFVRRSGHWLVVASHATRLGG